MQSVLMSAGEFRQLFSDLDVPLEPAVVIDQQSSSWLKNNQMKSKLSTKQLKRPCVMCKLVWTACDPNLHHCVNRVSAIDDMVEQ